MNQFQVTSPQVKKPETYRATRVSIVLGFSQFSSIHYLEQVLCQDRSLRGNGCSSLARRKVGAITQGPHVPKLSVSESGLVHLDPASFICNRLALHTVKRPHGGYGMQEGVIHDLSSPVSFLKRSLPVGRIDRYQVMAKVAANSTLYPQFVQSLRVLGHAEHCGHPSIKLGFHVVSTLGLAEPVPSHPHNLLRGASTFNYACRLREDSGTGPKCLDIRPNFIGGIVGVYRRDTRVRVCKSFGEAFNSIPINLKAVCYN